MIRISHLVSVGLLTVAPVFASSPQNPPSPLSYQWNVSVDKDGHLVSLTAQSDLGADVREPLERAIRGWTFEPGRIDDHAAATETTLTVDVSFVPAPQNRYAVRIDDARTGGAISFPKGDSRAIPRLPTKGIRNGTAALVVVKVAYDADGHVLTVDPQASESVASTPAFDQATVTAVRRWSARPERVGGHGVPAVVMVPVCYTVGTANTTFDCSWRPHGSRAVIGQGGALALESAVHLQTDIIGHAL
ncbi:MAG: hypothetical protein ABIR62_02875 [Dokdonella sp.]|uniref:energy transducer TonB n=1 Tax=Dokdonella sp. TaxID=2291710 RepID=UPI003266613C